MNPVSKFSKFFSKVNKLQFLLIITIPFNALVGILTWYSVIYTDIAEETASLTKFFISNLGGWGLIVSFIFFSGFFLIFWWLWVNLSNKENRSKNEDSILFASVALAMMSFVLAIFNLANDSLAFLFRTSVLLPFLNFPFLLIPIAIAFVLAFIVIHFQYPNLTPFFDFGSSKTEEQELVCDYCGGELNKFDFLSLQKYEVENQYEEPVLVDYYDFCSEECARKFQEEHSLKDFELYRITRCATYYECEKLGNLRNMCDKEELVNGRSYPLIPNINPTTWCEPAQGGIIKSNIKLIDSLKKFDKTSKRANRVMMILTGVIVFLTVVNFLLSVVYL